MQKQKLLLDLLKAEFKLATGCTDPAAIASAVALAAEQLPSRDVQNLDKIELELSPNIFKNGYNVDIPGTTGKGIPLAAALGYVMGQSKAGFEIFHGLTGEQVRLAELTVAQQQVEVRESRTDTELTIKARITAKDGGTAEVTVRRDYLRVCRIAVDGQMIYTRPEEADETLLSLGYKLEDLVCFAETVALEDIDFVHEGIETNKTFILEGLRQPRGLKISQAFAKLFPQYGASEDLGMKIKILTSAGVDARMGGCPLPVMSSAGSGNLGLGATVPLWVVSEQHGLPQETLQRGAALANLIHIYMKQLTGRLTSSCGSILVAMGTSPAIVWMLGGSLPQMAGATKNIAAGPTGIICDGANYGCSFKVSSTAVEAYYSALLALQGAIATSSDGIVSDDVDETIRHVAGVFTEMNRLDPVVLQMINGSFLKTKPYGLSVEPKEGIE
ncbi:serine dehydratase subunit alpha family protein [Paenibacillus thalictri]|nr:L-serine ammonia-lyase, iron-sulfur-dependent, subunit alpha [Paenibacillus thalictri]